MIPTPSQAIGDKWARNISKAFQDWADTEKGKQPRNISFKFDPTPQIAGAFYESGEAQLTELGKILGSGVSFDLRSPEAEKWISNYGAKEIKYINAGSKQAIRQITARAFSEGLTVQEQSKLIRPLIGLLPQHATAVYNYKMNLLRDPAMEEATAERLANKYAKKLLKWRADNIALTESHTASNEGLRRTNEDAVNRGIISKDEYEQEWLTSPDTHRCDKCSVMQGKRAPIGGQFQGDGSGPILHNRCRCTVIIVRKDSKPYMPKVDKEYEKPVSRSKATNKEKPVQIQRDTTTKGEPIPKR